MTTFAAGAALAAGLVGEKSCKVPCRAHHAGGFVHYNDAAGAEEAAGRLHRLVVEIYFLEFVRAQHRHRPAAGNDTLKFSPVGHAAAVFLKEFHERITHLQFIDAGFVDVAAHAEKLGAFALVCSHGRVGRRAVLHDPRQRR